ncbi:flagellin N-terminal helical domain-containing protein [Halomonas mongoliensis]|uniref:flagellin N-terminal helical domain-containing protein n=1 Tax=Halomonas mongoliensis TaxID=321265 RepID=UPI00403A979E
MSVINTNLTALKGQGSLSRAQGQLATSMERLSSGMRVNGAKDDAAGQAIGNRMTSQINGRGMAQRNANDGISMSQTAQGALDQVNEKLQRIRELTVQGLNGTLQTRDSDTVQAEINQNLMEIDRLAESVGYNGIPLLTGQAGKVDLQIGASDGQTLGLDFMPPGFSVQALGLEDFNVAGISGSVTPRDTLMGQAVDIVLEDPRTTVSYPTGAEKPLYTLGAVDAPGTYYVSMGGGNFSLVDVSASHVTATDESEVIIDNPRALYRTEGSLAEKGIDNLQDGQRLIRVDNTYYLEEEVDGRITYREAGFTVSFDEQGAPSAVLNPSAERLEGIGSGDYTYAEVAEDETIEVVRGNGTVTFDLADFDEITFQGLADAQDPALVVGEDRAGTSHYYVRNGSGADVSYYRVDGVPPSVRISVVPSDTLFLQTDQGAKGDTHASLLR